MYRDSRIGYDVAFTYRGDDLTLTLWNQRDIVWVEPPYLGGDSEVDFMEPIPRLISYTVLSIFPFTSPLVMPMRVATGAPSAVELVACYALLVPAILLAAFIGGRIYSGVILSSGKLSISNLISVVLRPKPAT